MAKELLEFSGEVENKLFDFAINMEDNLFFLVRERFTKKAKKLIKNGCNLNAKDEYGYTVLMYAVDMNYIDIIKELIKAGVDLNINRDNKTALSIAIENGNFYVAKLLIEAGAYICDIQVTQTTILKYIELLEKQLKDAKKIINNFKKINNYLTNKK